MSNKNLIQQRLGWDKIPSPALPSTKKKITSSLKKEKNSKPKQTNKELFQSTIMKNNATKKIISAKEWILPDKQDNTIRFISQNINGIPVSKKTGKSIDCMKTIAESSADV